MAKLFNRAKMNTSTSGSGTLTLTTADTGYQTFADAGVTNGDVVAYVIEEGTNWEIGTGTYSSSGTTLTRTPTESSGGGSAITLGGTAKVFITALADDFGKVQHDGVTKIEANSGGITVTGNVVVSGNVDGRNVAGDGTKLDGIASNAIANLVEDTSPQLGGDLDVNGKIITAASLNVALNPPVGGLLHLGLGTADAHSVMMYDLYKFPKATPNTGDVLTAGTNPVELEWSAPAGGGATNVASLIDVDSVDTVASGDFLLYDGSSSEYKFVAFQDEVNLLIDSRTGSSGHISTQSQYAGSITTDAADPTDTAHHILGNTGSASIHTASTAWYYGDVVSDPANPTTSVLLDVDQQRFTGNIQTTNISLGSPGSFNCQPGATLDLQGTTIHFGSASIAGGSAFNPVINNHLWSGATAPTDGYVLSWDASALSGAGDYSWIAPSGGSSYDQSLNTTDNVQFDSVTTDTINPLADSVNANGTNISIKAGEATALNSTGGFVNINGGAGALQDGDVYIAQSLPSGLGNNLVMGNGTNDALLNFNNITISGSPTFSNNVTMAAGVQERYVPLVGQGPGNVPYDAAFGQVMIHDTPTADHVADIVNLLISPQSATNVTIMLKNGPAPTIIQSVLFNGTAPASFQWQGGTPPTGNANATDVYSFTVYDDGFGVNVLGQMVSFA